MAKNTPYIVGGVAAGAILLWLLPWWVALLIIVGVPAAGYLMLDPKQRRRLRSQMSKREIGR
jgi:hypothetical protein